MSKDSESRLELDASVTRRDFLNSTLVGAGAALLGGCGVGRDRGGSPAEEGTGADWTGPGGVGDYRHSNGNTWDVVQAAHRVRDGAHDAALWNVNETGEQYDLVIVGGGFAGLAALYEFRKQYPHKTCLLLENHPIFGGYAKANEFQVDGYRLTAPQASLNFTLPANRAERDDGYWTELGLPADFQFAARDDGDTSIKFAKATSAPLYFGEQTANVGYFFQNSQTQPGGQWVRDMWSDDLRRAPFPEPVKKGLLILRDRKRQDDPDKFDGTYLDSLTLADFVTRDLKIPAEGVAEVLAYITQGMMVTGPQISAHGHLSLPNLMRFAEGSDEAKAGDRFISFPGGNTVLARHFVKSVFPDAVAGPGSLAGVASGAMNQVALDRQGAGARMRLQATAVQVKHEGEAQAADRVGIVYEKGGQLHRVVAKSVIMAVGKWIAKRIIADLPPVRRAALDQFFYAPMLMVNVALRNWRFIDKLGFGTARWFDGIGFFGVIRQPMLTGGIPAPFHPDKPIVMTIYVPFPNPQLPLEAQGPAGRAQLYAMSYAAYEKQIVEQLVRMFGSAGFDARRDIAGIILNRWGHTFVTPPPGFFFGKDGQPAPLKVASERVGRIIFAQTGMEGWLGAAKAGSRAVTELGCLI